MVLATTYGGCRDSWAEVRDGAPDLKGHLRLETEEVRPGGSSQKQ